MFRPAISSPRFSQVTLSQIESAVPTYIEYKAGSPALTLQDKFERLTPEVKKPISEYLHSTRAETLIPLLQHPSLPVIEEYADVLFEHFTFLVFTHNKDFKKFLRETKLDTDRGRKMHALIINKLNDTTFPLGASPKDALDSVYFKQQEVEELLASLPHAKGYIKQSIENLLMMRTYVSPLAHHALVAKAIGSPKLNYFLLVDFLIDKHTLRQSLTHSDKSSYDYKKYIVKPFERIVETKVLK